MNRLSIVVALLMLVLGVAGAANALPYTDVYYVDKDDRLMKKGDTIKWIFDLTKPDIGFNPDTQDVTSAKIELNFKDDKRDGLHWWEDASLNVGENNFSWEVDTGDISFTISSLMTLSDTGMVNCSLTNTSGDFRFFSATLEAFGTGQGHRSDEAAPVPEPATMLLLGAGLSGIAVVTRKRQHIKK